MSLKFEAYFNVTTAQASFELFANNLQAKLASAESKQVTAGKLCSSFLLGSSRVRTLNNKLNNMFRVYSRKLNNQMLEMFAMQRFKHKSRDDCCVRCETRRYTSNDVEVNGWYRCHLLQHLTTALCQHSIFMCFTAGYHTPGTAVIVTDMQCASHKI